MRLLAASVFVGALLLAASAPAATNPANQARLDSTIRYLQGVQNADGGFGGSPGSDSIQGFSAWVALALAAAGINPQDQARPGGEDVYGFLVRHFRQGVEDELCAPDVCTTAYERELMVVNAAGAALRNFGGIDLVAAILERQRPDGSFPYAPGGKPGINSTIFAILALAPVGGPAVDLAIRRAAEWVEGAQQDNGGWSWNDRNSPDEVDMTGAAIQALIAAGRGDTAVQRSGLNYLRDAQAADGGFPAFPGKPESNVASTAWAVQAIWAVGQNPETWLSGSGGPTEEPLDYMESLQEPDGHIRWKRSQDLNGVWMTAYAAPAFAGQAWPIPAAPRSVPTDDDRSGEGDGDRGAASSSGVLAGGGGEGAPLFSRPKPQSKGKTPGGARVLGDDDDREATDHSETRRGENAVQPTGTETAEAASVEEEVTSVSGSGDGTSTEGSGPGVGTSSAGKGGGGGAARGAGEEIAGTVIGDGRGQLAFGAPGLRGAGSSADGEAWVAAGIGAAALLLALGGAGWERRHREVAL